MPRLPYVALALSLSLSALAQTHPYPASVDEAPVICAGCEGTNSAGEPNEGKPTMPYDVPVVSHIGRYVGSSGTPNVQHLGMRTVRAETIRPNPANGRLYIKLGSTIGAYDLDTFFTSRLAEPMVPVSVMVTGSKYSGRTPLENVARPDGWVYPEAVRSGWVTPFVDSTERLHDLDVDDRGFVYYRSSIFGWGIHRDDGRTDGTMLPFVKQVSEPSQGHTHTLFTMKVATLDQFRYYAYVSDSVMSRVFDVTEAGAPALVREATTGVHHARSWAKNEGENHVAVLHGTNFLRIYSYAAILDGSAPLFEHLLPSGRRFDGLAFDEAGNLWIGEWGTTGAGTLWKLSAGGYEKTTFTLPGNQFRAEALHAGAGYVAVTGTELVGTVRRRDLQLLKVVDGTPEPVATGNWFRHYYHAAPSGFAQPEGYTNALTEPFLFMQDGLAYLFYSAYGLGDVFELGDELRPPETGGLEAPSNLSATAPDSSNVHLTWTPAPGSASFEVFLMNSDRTWMKVGSTVSNSFVHGGRVAGMGYIYSVRALDSVGHPSLQSKPDAATTVEFTDATIVPGMIIKGRQLQQVRFAVNGLRLAAGLPQLNWSSSLKVHAIQFEELRAAIVEARAVSGLPAVPFTDGSLAGVPVKAVHMQELMNAVR